MGNTSVNDVGSLIGAAGYASQPAGRAVSQTSPGTENASPSFESILNAGLSQNVGFSQDVEFSQNVGFSQDSELSQNAEPSQNTDIRIDDNTNDADKDLEETTSADYQKNDSDRIAGETSADAGKTSAADDKQDKNVVEDAQNEKTEVKDSDENVESKNLNDTDTSELSEETLEIAEQEVASAATALYGKVLDILGISQEEGDSILDEMGIDAGDLLDKSQLADFTLQAMGAEDSLSLLTNESQYEQFQDIMSELGETLNADSSFEGMSVGELSNLTKNTAEPVKEERAVNNSGEDITADINAVTDDDGNSLGAQAMLKSDSDDSRSSSEDKGHRNDNSHEDGGQKLTQQTMVQQNFSQPGQDVQFINASENISENESLAKAQDIANQIMDYIRSNVKADTQTLEMQLHPASLGNVQISLVNKGGSITANFVAQNEQVKAVLENQMITLQQRFEEQGMKVTSIEVSVAPHGFEQSMEQQSQGQAEQGNRAPQRVRRLNLDELNGIDDLTELDDDDRIAAEMMTANGGTVDLQA